MKQPSYADRISDQIKIVEQKIAALNSELADLKAAQRVLLRFEEEPVGTSYGRKHQEGFLAGVAKVLGQRTIADLIIEKLHECGPMESNSILDELRRTWRHDISSSTLLPTLSRMKAAGRIIKRNRRWMLPQTEEASLDMLSYDASKSDAAES